MPSVPWQVWPLRPAPLPSFVRVNRQRSRGSTSIASTFATMHASSRRSRPPWLPRRIGESSNTGAPPDFSRSSTCKSGGFQGSGQRSSVACHSEMVLSPGGFSYAGVSDDGDGSGDKDRKNERKTWGKHTARFPHMVRFKLCSPSSSDAHPEQVSRLTMTTLGLGHVLRRVRAPSSTTAPRA